ncbi:hypothetical protein SK128_010789 [Halocaridina rubra]|uniref:Uncharacterized protein n=1 Tax=Halocaridina rubra TaxID=373956 RepID=A0AAN8WVJ8_HALRR
MDLVQQRIPPLQAQEETESQTSGGVVKRSSTSTSPVPEPVEIRIKSRTPSPLSTPVLSLKEEILPDLPDQIKTPSPSPPPSHEHTHSGGQILTPQHSQEDLEEYHQETAETPSISPPSRDYNTMHPLSTPVPTPAGSPVKFRSDPLPVATPTDTPLPSEYSDKNICTPDQPLSSHQSSAEKGHTAKPFSSNKLAINHHPELSSNLKNPEIILMPPNTKLAQISVLPSFSDQGIQVDCRETGIRSKTPPSPSVVEHSQTESQEQATEETLSIVCNSSNEATTPSSAEVCDTTCLTLSEGEVLNSQLAGDISVEDGEIARMCQVTISHGTTNTLCIAHRGLPSKSLVCTHT